ncbi:MAG: hypothetical protein ACNA8W_07505 [Bradymonadaceae bacterium]
MNDENYYAPPAAELADPMMDSGGPEGLHGPVEFGDTLSRIFSFGMKHFSSFLPMAIFWGVLNMLVTGMTYRSLADIETNPSLSAFGGILVACFILMLAAPLIWAVGLSQAHSLNTHGELQSDVEIGLKRYAPLFGCYFLYTLAAMVGMMLCLVPGVILMTLLFPAGTIVIVEEKGPIESLERAWRLCRGDGFYVFGILFVLMFVFGLISVMMNGGLTLIMGFAVGVDIVIIQSVYALIYGVLSFPFMMSMTYIIYTSLVARRQTSRRR